MDAKILLLATITVLLLLLLRPPAVLCDSRWVLGLRVANSWMSGFTGRVNVCVQFSSTDNNSTHEEEEVIRHCLLLPWHRYDKGLSYRTPFEANATEDAEVSSMTVWTLAPAHLLCDTPTSDRLRLAEVSVHSLATGRKFQVDSGPWTVPRSCDAPAAEEGPLRLRDSVEPRPCLGLDGDGAVYEDGERFQVACSMSCRCTDGDVACVPVCPQYQAPGCSEAHEPGECCPRPFCSPGPCFLAEDNDCEAANRTVSLGEAPWAIFLKTCSANDTDGPCQGGGVCSGSLVAPEWVLTSSECVRGALASQVRLIAGELSIVVTEDAEVEVPALEVHVSQHGLALLKVAPGIEADRTVQPVALPRSREECLRLTAPSCAVALAGWVGSSADHTGYDLYKLTSRLEEASSCGPNSQKKGRRRKDPGQLCVSLTDDAPLAWDPDDTDAQGQCANEKRSYLCSGQQGLGLVAKAEDPGWDTGVNLLVGVVSYSLPDNVTVEQICHQRAHRLAVGVCNHLHWITTTMQPND